ncbi:response regulator transcription factor [Pelodictyon luteolum]|nr:response regulator transcription factor [Pelodictyon luteolum]
MQEHAVALKAFHPHRIIVVEDDLDFRESLIETLSLCGYEVVGARSALEFYQKVAETPCELVILDLGLPDQNGVVLAEYIRNNTDMRIVVLTARGALESRIAAYRAGADTYLLKPVDTDELVATIESNLGRVGLHEGDCGPGSGLQALQPRAAAWRLLRSDAVLITPAGERIRLSSREVDLLEILASSTGTTISRHSLIETLGYDPAGSGSQALDVLIHRLRQKASESGSRLPVKTIRAKGYIVSEPLYIE